MRKYIVAELKVRSVSVNTEMTFTNIRERKLLSHVRYIMTGITARKWIIKIKNKKNNANVVKIGDDTEEDRCILPFTTLIIAGMNIYTHMEPRG